ncbi:hypothetical protein P7K49_018086 [Saguinus oedipus]|uniref:Uncharacterized protein n=1 Tax=Saguinus oedipus TaxID=9490 RepID=A0ABQ9V505_SAGOE|nr:hypothetical protein P7K49_018086 [Saguinus oedipus]
MCVWVADCTARDNFSLLRTDTVAYMGAAGESKSRLGQGVEEGFLPSLKKSLPRAKLPVLVQRVLRLLFCPFPNNLVSLLLVVCSSFCAPHRQRPLPSSVASVSKYWGLLILAGPCRPLGGKPYQSRNAYWHKTFLEPPLIDVSKTMSCSAKPKLLLLSFVTAD